MELKIERIDADTFRIQGEIKTEQKEKGNASAPADSTE